MSHPKYTCKYCSFECTSRFVVNHQLKHHSGIFRKEKYSVQGGMRKGTVVSFPIILDKKEDTVYSCFGCNKFWARKSMADNHMSSCENKKKHIEVCKSILEPEGEQKDNSVESSEMNEKMNEEFEKMKEQLKKLQKKVKDLEEENDTYEQKSRCFDHLVTFINNHHDSDEVVEELATIEENFNKDITEGVQHTTDWTDYF